MIILAIRQLTLLHRMKQFNCILGSLFTLLILQSCAQTKITEDLTEKESIAKPTQLGFSGHWSCVKRYIDYNPEKTMLAMDADQEWLDGKGNLIIENDSMWYFDYPREFHAAYALQMESDGTMTAPEAINNKTLNKLEIRGDSLVRTIGNGEHIILTEYYLRDTLNQEIIQRLLTDSVNTDELIRTWKLVTIIDEPGTENLPLKFPFPPPDSLVFNKENLSLFNIDGRIMNLDIEGKSRTFRFGFSLEDGCLYLEPTSWYKNEEPLIINYYQSN